MSHIGKIGFLIAALSFVIVAAVRFILGAWIPFLFLLIGIAGLALVLSFISDRKLYLEFFTLRTTKHGMNMGALILLVFTLIVCVNYISVRHNKTWDVTKEKLNSLSDQSRSLLKNLKSDVDVKVFYKGADALGERQAIRQALGVYQENSNLFKVRYIDSYLENMLAQEYLAPLQDRDQEAAFMFVEYEGKRIRVDSPFGEEQITSALVKATRRGEMKVYFITGHGEKELQSEAQGGLKAMAQELESASYQTEELSLYDKSEIPSDASLVVVMGPKQPFLDSELTVLKNYLSQGGRLLLAIDPGEKHNFSSWLTQLGVIFKNNYIINLDPVSRQASAAALGVIFDRSSPMTSSLPEGKTLTIFDMASELNIDSSKPESIQVTELVKTAPTSFTMNELKSEVAAPKDPKSFTVVMGSKGKFQSSDAKEFQVVTIGDSDFFTNRLFLVGSNRDFAMNSLAALTDQDDLITIRPKQAQGNKLMLTTGAQMGMVSAGVALPVLLLLLSAVFWYRRRGA